MSDIVKEAPAAKFTEWLISQQSRVDDIGAFAAAVAHDEGWPGEATFGVQRNYLVEARMPRHVPALARAWQEYADATAVPSAGTE